MAWARAYLLIVRDSDRAEANARYALIDPDTGGGRTFDFMPLARRSSPSVTVAAGAITRATLTMVQRFGERLQDLIDAGKVKVYRLDNGAWTVATALADAWPGGLVRTQEA